MTQTPETARRTPGLRWFRGVAGLAISGVVALAGDAAQARDLRVGLSAEPTSMDPHFHNLGPNNALRRHIFESLIDTDAQMRLKPSLALSWTPRDTTTWEF